MRVSDCFHLPGKQPTLDFVDVDIETDARLFIDPRALMLLPTAWGQECTELVRRFFELVIREIRNENHESAQRLLAGLSEPNETHLGLSAGRSQGRAVGPAKAEDIWRALSKSEAVRTGLIEKIEDTLLLVPGIGPDIISDMATNVIREPLVRYTQSAARIYGIPLTPDVWPGNLWNPSTGRWEAAYRALPMVGHSEKLLLVPKSIVRRRLQYDAGEYYNNYILPVIQEEELTANSGLVQLLKNGNRRVTKKDARRKIGFGKEVIVEQTIRHPEVLDKYRSDHRMPNPPLDHLDLAKDFSTDLPDYRALLSRVRAAEPGRDEASEYEKAILALFTALFYPALSDPTPQARIEGGQKIVDITFVNLVTAGFFKFLPAHIQCPQIIVECKNYNETPGNPEVDQLAGRFAPQRGRFGLLVCRNMQNRSALIERCRSTAAAGRGWIVPLEDADLGMLIDQRIVPGEGLRFGLLHERLREIQD